MGLFGWFRRKRQSAVADSPAQLATVDVAGRKHALGVPYMLPQDEGEINRLDFQHYMLRSALGGNYAAPIGEPRAILDVGAGTGRWAREMAELFPQARVVGQDIALPQADQLAVGGRAPEPLPPNYTFVAGNVFEGLSFADGEFDFVHQRLLFLAIPLAQWQSEVNELVRVTRPGGWVELVEGGLSQSQGDNLQLLVRAWTETGKRRGIDMQVGSRIDEFLRGAGLAHVTIREVVFPMGAYGGHIGRMLATDLTTAGEAMKGAVVKMGILDADTYSRALEGWRAELQTHRQTYPFYIAYGQRVQ